MKDDSVIGKECRFVSYVPAPNYDKPDLHFVKEITHYKDGRKEPTVNLVYNYQRPFWIVNKGARDYKQPKEWIEKNKTIEYKSSQKDLIERASKALGTPWFKGNLKKLQENPYLFGTDIKSTAVLKKAYQDRYKECPKTAFESMYLDVETDVLYGTDEIIMITVYYKNQCITGVVRRLEKGYHDLAHRVEIKTKQYLQEYIDKYHIEFEYFSSETEIDLLKDMFMRIHALRPDFLAIWNMDFEIGRFLAACGRAGVDFKDIASDPEVPKEYKYFNYMQGPSQKRTASGKVMPIPPAMRWHTVHCPASFYFIDAMCAYKHIRMGQPEKPSYSLDSILGIELKLSKLKFKEADKYERLKWHVFMQEHYMPEYIVYNRFDTIGMMLLEEKTKDLSVFLPLFSGTSDFEDFKSQPRRLCDQLHWTVLEKGKVMGTTSERLVDENTGSVLPLNGWISNLAAELITEQGLRIIQENPELNTLVYTNVGD